MSRKRSEAIVRKLTFILITGILWIGLSCSNSQDPASGKLSVSERISRPSGTAQIPILWGMWEVSLESPDSQPRILPCRSAEFTANVTRFMQPPSSSSHKLTVQVIDSLSDWATGHIVVDVSFIHPFPGLNEYTGFDVRGICMGNGSVSCVTDSNLLYAGPDDLKVLNADGLTRWFNPTEFTSYDTIFGFTQGKLGTPSKAFSATLNGYKYFCDGLGKEDSVVEFFASSSCPNPRGYFSAGNKLTRTYDLQFGLSGGSPQYKFQYAVIASWEPPLVKPPANIPDDFSISANCHEAYAFSASDASDMYFVDSSTKGGTLRIKVRVFDHQGGASEIRAVHLETTGGLINSGCKTFTGATLDSTLVSQDSKSVTYLFEVDSVTPYAAGEFPVLIGIESFTPSAYDSGFPGFIFPPSAKLTAYFITSVQVLDKIPAEIIVTSPNGGEIWCKGVSYPITWTSSNVSGNVKIDLSKDGGVTWPTTIAANTPNDGTESWTPQAGDVTSKAKIKISSLINPSIWDASDSDFQIVDLGTGWVRAWGGSQGDRAWRCLTDNQGNIYVTGYFASTVDFDPGPGNAFMTALHAQSIFLSKFDINGNFVWAKMWGTSENTMGDIYGLCVDNSDNVYVGGSYFGTVDFDPNAGVVNRTSVGYYDAFIVKLTPAGNFVWAKTWGGSVWDVVTDIKIDGSGNLYASGWYRGTNTNFNPGGTPVLYTSDLTDPFLVKYSLNGDFIWAKVWGQNPPASIFNDYAWGVAVFGSSVYVSGGFGETVDFDPNAGVQNKTSNGGRDTFLLRLDSNGNFVWVGTWGGTGASSQLEYGGYVGVDSAGNVYCTGTFESSGGIPVDFDPDPGNVVAPPTPIRGTYLSKFNPSNNLVWARTWGTTNYFQGKSNTISVSKNGDSFVTGTLQQIDGSVDFDPGPGSVVFSAEGPYDGYLSKFNANGDFQWVNILSGSNATVDGHGVHVPASGLIYIVGFFGGTVDFMPGPGVDTRFGTNGDAFLVKYMPNGMW